MEKLPTYQVLLQPDMLNEDLSSLEERYVVGHSLLMHEN